MQLYLRSVLRACGLAAGLALLATPAGASTILVEDFEADFPAWESGWLGTNSNLANYYCPTSSCSSRGNNPDGLWLDDGDGSNGGDTSTILFDSGFGAGLTGLSIDVAAYVPVTLRIFDAAGNTLLQSAVSGGNAFTDPGTYLNFSVQSLTGIGGFEFLATGGQVEGNTSIDNVTATAGTVPEPTSLFLLGTALTGLALRRRRAA